MADNEMRLDFLSLSENESFARSCAAAFCTQLNPTIEELSDVRTAISEAVTNAIIHGYENRSGMVHLRCTLEGDLFTATVRDDGVGIRDIEQARQPFFTTRPELERSGMGFTVMESFTDSLRVSSKVGKGTTVTMLRRLSERGRI